MMFNSLSPINFLEFRGCATKSWLFGTRNTRPSLSINQLARADVAGNGDVS